MKAASFSVGVVLSAVAAVGAGACGPARGTTAVTSDGNFASVSAGNVVLAGGGAVDAEYVIDAEAQVCWFLLVQIGEPDDIEHRLLRPLSRRGSAETSHLA